MHTSMEWKRLHLKEVLLQLLLALRHADALAATTFRCFQHHGVANPLRAGDGLLH